MLAKKWLEREYNNDGLLHDDWVPPGPKKSFYQKNKYLLKIPEKQEEAQHNIPDDMQNEHDDMKILITYLTFEAVLLLNDQMKQGYHLFNFWSSFKCIVG